MDRSYYLGMAQQFGPEHALDMALRDLAAMHKTIEAYSALARLPVPPQEIGDGPDERIGWILALLEDLRDALDRSHEGWRVLANATPEGGWVYLAKEFAQRHFQEAGETLAQLPRREGRANRRFTCAHCRRDFDPEEPGVVLNVIHYAAIGRTLTVYACSNLCGLQVKNWTSEQWRLAGEGK